MFTADLAWAGPLLGVAALALRTYLKGRSEMPDKETHPYLQLLRDEVWEDRHLFLDAILFHTCGADQAAKARIWVVGWEEEDFVQAALRSDRSILRG